MLQKTVQKMMLLWIISFVTFYVEDSNAELIFKDNFDDSPSWQSKESWTNESPGTIGWGVSRSLALQAPQGWSDHRAARGQLPGSNGKQTFEISSTTKRGASGQSLVANYEMVNNWVGGHLGKWLGSTGYDDIYVRWYRYFQPGWKYRTASGGVIHKWFRLMSNVDDPAGVASVDPTNMYLTPSARPDWMHNCPVENADNQCGKQAYIMLRDTQSPGRFGINEVSTYQLAYNPEGKAGTTQNDTYVNFDGNARLYWNDWHATKITGNPGEFPWSSGNSTGIDWQGNGQWVAYEVHAKMNDIGVANALVELFVNGEKVAQVSKFTLRNTPQTKFNYLMMPDNMDNEIYGANMLPPPAGEQYFAIDDVVISTHYSGPPPKPTTVAAQVVADKTAKVTWSAGSNGATYLVDGYRVYYGTEAAAMTSSLAVGNVTEAQIPNLEKGKKYFFAVTAFNKQSYDSNENESLKSSTIDLQIGSAPPAVPATPSGGWVPPPK